MTSVEPQIDPLAAPRRFVRKTRPQRGDMQYGRSQLTNNPRALPRKPLSRRALDRRRKDLIGSFLAALGPDVVDGLRAVMVRKAAELTVMVEMARAGMLNGEPTDMLALVRLEGVAARAVRALGLKIEPVPPKTTRVLELRRQRWEEAAEAKAAQAAQREASSEQNPTELPDGREADK
jgi:hypothetical protein